MKRLALILALLLAVAAAPAAAAAAPPPSVLDNLARAVSLRDYNTRIVIAGVSLLGLAAGGIGTFLLLRKRSLTADALSHATLPGIALAFIIATSLGGEGRALGWLLLGAFATGVAGVGVILLIRHTTRIKEDAALGIVLSVFFGAGAALIKLAEQMPQGSAAGLDRFILGRAASMIAADVQAIAVITVVVLAVCTLLFKEFRLLCFDQSFAGAQGWPVLLLDALLMALVVAVTVIGLQSVGLVLVVALLITPAAAARFWTDRLAIMFPLSAAFGAVGGAAGAIVSAAAERMPTGPIIVLVCSALFAASLVFGSKRGLLMRLARHWRLQRRVAEQHLLRALWEAAERAGQEGAGCSRAQLRSQRSWSALTLRRGIARLGRRGWVRLDAEGGISLTAQGRIEAQRVVRNHRLWEMYLITHADIAPTHVDRDADQIEHVLPPELIARLEELVTADASTSAVPASPHELVPSGPGGRP